jgi:capsule polysaccharide export protein KpsE/RkpR
MATPKVLVAKRAAALKLKLHKAATVLEKARLDAEQHAREAEELAVFLAPAPEVPVLAAEPAPVYCEAGPVVVDLYVLKPDVKRSLWKRFLDWL